VDHGNALVHMFTSNSVHRADGCENACPDETGVRTLIVQPYRWEDIPTGGVGYYECPKCRTAWSTSWAAEP
jgi:hypothetical protein